MKRIIALLAVAGLIFGLFCACGQNGEGDLAYVTEKGELVVGITDFAPMDYKINPNDTDYIGFDADMAKAFAEYLGVKVRFVEIDWGKKAIELETKAIDVVWNGMTLDDEVRSLMSTGNPYCKNAQVVVLNAAVAGNYTTEESLKSLTFAAENESAGMKALTALGISCTAVDTQSKALMEVASGAVDGCVIDLLMAGAMIGEGTDYPNLAIAMELSPEEYGVGFRKGSDLTEKFNEFWKKAYADGTVTATAEKYGIAKNVIAQ